MDHPCVLELGCLSLCVYQGLSVSTMVWYRAEIMWTPCAFRHDQWKPHTRLTLDMCLCCPHVGVFLYLCGSLCAPQIQGWASEPEPEFFYYMVAYACNPSIQEAEAGGTIRIQGYLDLYTGFQTSLSYGMRLSQKTKFDINMAVYT